MSWSARWGSSSRTRPRRRALTPPACRRCPGGRCPAAGTRPHSADRARRPAGRGDGLGGASTTEQRVGQEPLCRRVAGIQSAAAAVKATMEGWSSEPGQREAAPELGRPHGRILRAGPVVGAQSGLPLALLGQQVAQEELPRRGRAPARGPRVDQRLRRGGLAGVQELPGARVGQRDALRVAGDRDAQGLRVVGDGLPVRLGLHRHRQRLARPHQLPGTAFRAGRARSATAKPRGCRRSCRRSW